MSRAGPDLTSVPTLSPDEGPRQRDRLAGREFRRLQVRGQPPSGTLLLPTHSIAHKGASGILVGSLEGNLLPKHLWVDPALTGGTLAVKSCLSISSKKPGLPSRLYVKRNLPLPSPPITLLLRLSPVPGPGEPVSHWGTDTVLGEGRPVPSPHWPPCCLGQYQAHDPPSLSTRPLPK